MKMKKIKLAKHQDGTKQEYNEGDFKDEDCEDADEEENIDVGSSSFQSDDEVAVKFEPADDKSDNFNLHPFHRISFQNNHPVLPNKSFANSM